MVNEQVVPVQTLDCSERFVQLPKYESAGAAGADVRAFLPVAPVLIPRGSTAMIPTGLRVAVPEGFELQVRPRSGNALKKGLTVLNTPGTIDSDYRGEICVILANLTGEPEVVIEHQDRIAQLVLCPVYQIVWEKTEWGLDDLWVTDRGASGFGSTGGMPSNEGESNE